MIGRAALLTLAFSGGAAAAQTTPHIRLHDAGPGIGPKVLARELAGPYTVVAPGSTRYILVRDSTFRRTVIVLGRDVVVDGTVQGDIVVVGGDLYMHPGARVSGRAVSIGGGVYESSLATIGGGSVAFRDFTYSIMAVPPFGYVLDYQLRIVRDSSTLTWPGFFGVGMPKYDRSNGLSLGFGPRFYLPNTNLAISPRITYRSQLGMFDPSITAVDSVDRRTAVTITAGRETLSNDAWIWSDLVNSAAFASFGTDTRNYYRADRAELKTARRWESVNGDLTPFVGVQFEKAATVRPGLGAQGGPWTLFNRDDLDDALRPNPPVDDGSILSLVTGATWEWASGGIVTFAQGRIEAGGSVNDCTNCALSSGTRFVQLTGDGSIAFPTFGTQTFGLVTHLVVTGDNHGTPRQRWAYLGGPGTLPTLDLLSLGGDQLLFMDFRYNVPVNRVQLPMIGPPTVALREVIGGADIGRFPVLHQSAGVRVSLAFAYVELMIDPVTRRTNTGFGVSLAR